MKKSVIIIGVLIFGLWGCSKDVLTDPSNPESGNSSLKKSEVKTFTLKGVKMQNHATANPQIFMITGNFTHMGNVSPNSMLTITGMWPDMENPQFGPDGNPTNFKQTCEINMVGADGSSLHFVTKVPGSFSFATGYGETSWIIDSGTGRFDGATGWYESTSQYDFTTGINSVMGGGEIYITKK